MIPTRWPPFAIGGWKPLLLPRHQRAFRVTSPSPVDLEKRGSQEILEKATADTVSSANFSGGIIDPGILDHYDYPFVFTSCLRRVYQRLLKVEKNFKTYFVFSSSDPLEWTCGRVVNPFLPITRNTPWDPDTPVQDSTIAPCLISGWWQTMIFLPHGNTIFTPAGLVEVLHRSDMLLR